MDLRRVGKIARDEREKYADYACDFAHAVKLRDRTAWASRARHSQKRRASAGAMPTLPAAYSSSPHLLRYLDDHPQLRPLFRFGQHVAVLGRGKAALRRQAQLIDVDEFCRLVDAAPELVATLERAGFRRHQPEHHLLALRHEAQRLETAGAG